MANSSLHRHFHTHTKKLCKAPPEYPLPPPACWPPAIPGTVQSKIITPYGHTLCRCRDVFVAKKIGTWPGYCRYEFGFPQFSYPSHVLELIFYTAGPTLTISLLTSCSAYVGTQSLHAHYPISPGLSPHKYSLAQDDWSHPSPIHRVSVFEFTV